MRIDILSFFESLQKAEEVGQLRIRLIQGLQHLYEIPAGVIWCTGFPEFPKPISWGMANDQVMALVQLADFIPERMGTELLQIEQLPGGPEWLERSRLESYFWARGKNTREKIVHFFLASGTSLLEDAHLSGQLFSLFHIVFLKLKTLSEEKNEPSHQAEINEQLRLHQEELRTSLEDLRMANDELERKQQQLEAIFNQASEAIITLDAHAYITGINDYACNLFGYGKDELKDQSVLQLMDIDSKAIVSHYITKADARAGEALHAELTLKKKNGSQFSGEFAINHTPNIGEVSYIVVIMDLTVLKRKEEEIRRAKELYELVAHNSADIISLHSVDGRRVYVSPACLEMTGYTPDEVMEWDLMENVHPDDIEKVLDLYRIQQLDGRLTRATYRLRHKDGHYVWLESNIKAIFATDGTPSSYVEIIRNVDERVRYETDLINARHEVEEAMIAKDRFFSVMSHEIRTPLNAVIGMANLLLMESPRADQAEKIKTLKFSADTLLTLINDILDYSKIQAGHITFEKVNFEVALLARSLINTFQILAQDKGITLVLEIAPDVPETINGDPARVSQIINNLLSNAVKFTPEGSITLSVRLAESGKGDDLVLLFEVKDTGIGIHPSKHQIIFEPFHQAAQDTSRKYGGTGLGLSIVQNLVELLNGKIALESRPGHGSTFSVYLPFAPADGSEKVTISENGPSFGKVFKMLSGLKVLYVEDVLTNQMLMRGFCSNWDFDLEVVSGGEEAVSKVAGKKYDVVLMDIQMPGMDGYQATSAIRRLDVPWAKSIPVLALTAEVSDVGRKKMKEVGMDDYISKPIDPADLYQKLAIYGQKVVASAIADLPEKQEVVRGNGSTTDILSFTQPEQIFLNVEDMAIFLELVLSEFEIYEKVLAQYLVEHNVVELRRSIHKMNPTLKIFEAFNFLALLEEVREHMINENYTKVHVFAQRTTEACEQFLGQIREKLESLSALSKEKGNGETP